MQPTYRAESVLNHEETGAYEGRQTAAPAPLHQHVPAEAAAQVRHCVAELVRLVRGGGAHQQ